MSTKYTDGEIEEALDKYSRPSSARERPLWINNLLYGNYKCGKTTTACRVGKRQILYAADQNWSVIKDWPELDRVEVVEHQNLKHFQLFCEAMLRGIPKYREFDHLLIDPFNALVDERIDWQQDNFRPTKQGENRVEWVVKAGNPDKDAQPFSTPGMSDYAAVRDYFRRYIPKLCRLPMHVTIICHVREPGFADKIKEIRAAVPGKTHEMLARNMNLISYMEAKGGKRTISFETDRIHDGGSIFKDLHGQVINADDLPKWYEKYTTTGGN